MHLDAWSSVDVDPARGRRLAFGALLGAGLLGTLVVASSAARGETAAPVEEEPLTVELVTLVPDPAPPPLAEVPAPDAAVASLAHAGPARKPLAAPRSIPTAAPMESDAPAGPAYDDSLDMAAGVGSGSGQGKSGPGAKAAPPSTPAPTAAPRPRPAPIAAAGPMKLPDNATAPVALGNTQPGYPEEARRAGVEATVVVKFVVSDTGAVTNVSVVRGHPMFDGAVLAAVRSWRYRPALFEGRAIPVFRVARFPFKLRT